MLRGIDWVSGSRFGDEIVGDRHPNLFFGGGGDDVMERRAGDDCFEAVTGCE